MNKAQMIDAMAEEAGLSKADAKKALDALTKTVANTLAAGEPVQILGFGSFSVSSRDERKGRNPQTGQTIIIPAKKVAKFKAGKELAEGIQ